MKYYLAIDIGASSGRHILGHIRDGKMQLEEIYRFHNGMSEKDGELCWDYESLFTEIKAGMKKCSELNKIPVSVGIDTWAVDFVLLDKENKVLGNTVGYRDGRTKGMDQKVYECISEVDLYRRTGIQKQIFNSIYQLMAVKENHPEYLEKAETMLMVPDYFHYLLSGIKKTEYTNATTTGLVSPDTKNWDYDLINQLGYPRQIFREIKEAGSVIGGLTEEIQKEVGYNCEVILPATHDTGSAVLAVPSNEEDTLYISSGTWSLMGIERIEADCSSNSREHNLTNEGGYEYRFRYLKNIMGLWMIQSMKKEIKEDYSFGEICEMASKETIESIVDCNNDCFLAPKSMSEEVQKYCLNTNQVVPKTVAETAAVIYNSLAKCYQATIEEIEELTGRTYGKIHVIGGGANAEYLNQITARDTKRTVLAGPVEATAIGNLMVQMIQKKELENLESARNCVYESFEIKKFDA
ncbi:rhamnulokinase [Anaeromicropila herbilytica]|uniref:Rhamnulokinase n=1 Tax=Anaeromicropila herbilytica TaxID=2785025 RepID=A0A7R7IB31_9FIRM|nr:rhamnulokinase [Anaeromicropila herbilytica]BCN29133.1 rhamnulokinase [Anaeromicropila herbilytica]